MTLTDAETRRAWLRALELTAPIAKSPARTLPVLMDELAERFGDTPALLSDTASMSYRQLAFRANQYARWALREGLAKGDTVCLLMPNHPEYLAIWLGLSGVGIVVALLNTRLRDASLAHCISVVQPRHIIVAASLLESFASAEPHLSAPMEKAWFHGGAFPRIDHAADEMPSHPLDETERPPVALSDRALCIYTSGTTGLPKAANVSHFRVMTWSHWFAGLMQTSPTDRMFNCLPMYHSMGGVAAPGALLVAGGSVVLQEGFSASRFWDQVIDHDCTIFQYIGELCRYLANTPPHPRERAHRLRLCCGNGLREDVWNAFQSRFAIPRILEFYAATEGNFSLYNVEGRPGAIGRVPRFLAARFPMTLLAYDTETDTHVRDAAGFCLRSAPGEIGEAVARLDPARAEHAFEGYVSAADSERRILRNVFEPGDAWLRTGDLMRKDAEGYYYFADRIGDTFRWKGENVATTEISGLVAASPGVRDAVVYGVRVPGTEGRAGMAAIVVEPDFDIERFHAHLHGTLPPWARPLFIRIRSETALTATFRPMAAQLAREGFDPAAIPEPLYFDDAANSMFIPLDRALHTRIAAGELRL